MLFSLLHLSASQGNYGNFRPLALRSLASHHCVLVGSASTMASPLSHFSSFHSAQVLEKMRFLHSHLHTHTVCFPTRRQPWQTILYPTELFSHLLSFPEEQHMQLLLPQFLFLRGSDLASLLTEFPALSMTLTSIPMESPKSLQAAFIFSVSSPAVGSIINGAETLLAPVWCQVVAFLSFSSLGAALCQLLARWIGRTPPSSSSHIFLNFLTASMMTWWRTVSG